MLTSEALRADLRFAVIPALVGAGERAVVRVPHGDRAGVELGDQLRRDRVLGAVALIHRVVQPVELTHRNRVETDPGAGGRDGRREGRQELVLPGEILALLLTVADAEACVAVRGLPERAVPEDAAVDELLLVARERVLLGCDEHFVVLFDVPRAALAARREDHVVRRTGELSLAGPAGGGD